jgi:uncharacterized protein with HEPN domain
MADDATIALRDSLEELALLHDIAAGMTLAEFLDDPIVRRSAIRSLEIISQGVRLLPAAWLADHPALPWTQVGAFSERVRRTHYRVDDTLLWLSIVTETGPLKSALEAMLARHCGPAGAQGA